MSDETEEIGTSTQETDDEVDSTVKLAREGVDEALSKADAAYPSLLIISGPAVGLGFKIKNPGLIIGRAPDSDLTIVDDSISRKHLRVDLREGDVYVEDLDSTNGVFVNGMRVTESRLSDGDRVRIGASTVMKFSYQDALEETFQRQMYESAVRDSLTNAYNRRHFHERLKADFSYCVRHEQPLSVMMVDIDHFRQINTEYSHLAGDAVLVAVSRMLGKGIRMEDALCRYGGEEFGIILRNIDTDSASLMGERIRKMIDDNDFEYEGNKIDLTVSVGVTTMTDANYESVEKLVEEAEACLAAAKEGGRNSVVSAPRDS